MAISSITLHYQALINLAIKAQGEDPNTVIAHYQWHPYVDNLMKWCDLHGVQTNKINRTGKATHYEFVFPDPSIRLLFKLTWQ